MNKFVENRICISSVISNVRYDTHKLRHNFALCVYSQNARLIHLYIHKKIFTFRNFVKCKFPTSLYIILREGIGNNRAR